MKIIITEEQNKLLIESDISQKINNAYKSSQEYLKNLLKHVGGQLINTHIRFLLTYGAGISGLIRTVEEGLIGKYSHLTSEEVTLIAIASIFSVFYSYKDVSNLFKRIKKLGVEDAFFDGIRYVEGIKKKYYILLKTLGLSVHRGADFVAYANFLPVLRILVDIISNHGINSDQVDVFFQTVPTTLAINMVGIAAKDFFDFLAEKIYEKREEMNNQDDILPQEV